MEQGAGPLLDSIIRLRSTSQVPTVYILLARRMMTRTDYVRSEAETHMVTSGLRIISNGMETGTGMETGNVF